MKSKENSNKFCKNCGEEINKNEKKCPKCGTQQSPSVWIIILIVVGILLIIGIFFGGDNNNESTNPGNNNSSEDSTIDNQQNPNSNVNSNSNVSNKKVYNFDEPFQFDNLEITIGSNYSFDIVNNRYSEYNNQTAIKLPITVKNISSETHGLNMFYYDVYGSNGTQVEDLNSFFDDNIDYAGDLRSGATYTKYMYFLYDGNGTYAIEFDNYTSKITVEFNIQNS